jgi:hypothetical protein
MPDHATLYVADPSMMGSRVFDKVPDVGRYTGLDRAGNATGVRFEWDDASITMNFMPAEASFLLNLNMQLNSLLFLGDTIYDFDATAIAGRQPGLNKAGSG